jgi:CYTH domain-containing protein
MRVRIPSLTENKYARPEYERRLLLKEPPDGLDQSAYVRVVDHYLRGTRLRLRRMERPQDDVVQYKLAVKFNDNSLPEGCVALTNLYLTEDEYDYLRPFVGSDSVVKRRYPFVDNGLRYGVDVFEGLHAGLILAEIGFETAHEYERFSLPDFAVEDVTKDAFFNGGRLARVLQSLFESVLAERLKNQV